MNILSDYDAFIAGKVKAHQPTGFEREGTFARDGAEYQLFDWQEYITRWALKRGRAALFEDCGLGKSGQQVIWADEVVKKTGQPVLILCPLAVAKQTVREAEHFGIAVAHVKEGAQVNGSGIYITNYDRVDHFEAIIPKLAGIVLDESSILKSFTGKTRRTLTQLFANTPYRLACTATPAPNDFTELGQHAEWLGVMKAEEMLATWFVNDTFDTGTWRLKGHAEEDFWRWVASWAACVSKPSDIGFSDEGYILPPLNLIQHVIQIDETTGAQEGELFRAGAASATNLHKEARISIQDRAKKALDIATAEDGPAIVWCELNDEADELKKIFPADCTVEVRGSDKSETKESRLEAFSQGNARFIITKPDLGGFGLNWQHCSRQIFVGQSFSMEREYQAVRRSYRFGQKSPVSVHFVVPSTLGDVRAAVRRKFEDHAIMQERMKAASKVIAKDAEESTFVKTDIQTVTGDGWTLHHGDCVRVAKEKIASDSVGFSIFSPPFPDVFVYSADQQDMGNCKTMEEFKHQLGFLAEELNRVTMPGRECAVHCVDLLSTKWKDGDIQLKDFAGEIVRVFKKHKWLFHSRITIWKSPVTEMQRTKAHGLLYKTLRSDSADSRVGAPDYLLVFRKRGENTVPITHSPEDIPLDRWQELASPVWMTVDQSNVLNGKTAREYSDERHICPLQLDVIENAMTLWSAPGDLVFSPFTGVGSEGFVARKMGRKFVGAELKGSYFKDACQWLKQATAEQELVLK